MARETVSQRRLNIHGHELAVLSANERRSGTPVVFLHGITASVEFWLPSLPDSLRNTVHWISLSLPGHPPSRFPAHYRSEDITAELFADLTITALSRLVGERPVAVVGWSTGGFTALILAARHPERVRSILSLSGFACGRWHGLGGLMQALARGGRPGKRAFEAIFGLLARRPALFRLIMGQASADRRAFHTAPVSGATLELWHNALRHQDLGVLAELFERIWGFDVRALLPTIRADALIVGGDRDPYIPLSHTRAIAESIPGAELVILERTGHMFFADCTRRYQWLLSDWLNRTAGYELPLEPRGALFEQPGQDHGRAGTATSEV